MVAIALSGGAVGEIGGAGRAHRDVEVLADQSTQPASRRKRLIRSRSSSVRSLNGASCPGPVLLGQILDQGRRIALVGDQIGPCIAGCGAVDGRRMRECSPGVRPRWRSDATGPGSPCIVEAGAHG